jgi:hypothetical protein
MALVASKEVRSMTWSRGNLYHIICTGGSTHRYAKTGKQQHMVKWATKENITSVP